MTKEATLNVHVLLSGTLTFQAVIIYTWPSHQELFVFLPIHSISTTIYIFQLYQQPFRMPTTIITLLVYRPFVFKRDFENSIISFILIGGGGTPPPPGPSWFEICALEQTFNRRLSKFEYIYTHYTLLLQDIFNSFQAIFIWRQEPDYYSTTTKSSITVM